MKVLGYNFSIKKENVPIINDGDKNTDDFLPEVFYPTNLHTEQKDKALISMYLDLPEVSAPINYIIDKTAGIPIVHEKKVGDKWVEIENSKYLDLLKEPNQYQGESLYRKQFLLNYLVLGNAYQNALKPIGFRTIKKLFVLPSENVDINLQNKSNYDFRENLVESYSVDLGGSIKTIPFENIVHSKQATLTDEYYLEGRSRLMSAILTSKSLTANYEARVAIYESRGAMGILTPKNSDVVLEKSQAQAIINGYQKQFGITRGKTPILATPVSLDYTNISPDFKGLQLNENKLQDYQTICSVLSFPSILLNDNSTSTYNNITSAAKTFYENVSMPLNTVFVESLSKIFGLNVAKERFRADYSEVQVLQANENEKVTRNSTMWNDGVITENEYRESMGKAEIQGGDNRKNISNGQINT